MKISPTSFAIYRDDEHPIHGESSTRVSLTDEGGGPFIVVTQWLDGEEQTVRLEFDEIELLVQAVEQLKGVIDD